jgi:hypothetical protein
LDEQRKPAQNKADRSIGFHGNQSGQNAL